MNDCTFLSPTRLVVGRDAERQAAQWIRTEGGTRVLVHHSGGHAKKSGLVDLVMNDLRDAGLYVEELGGVAPNPRLSLVYEGIELCRRERIDFLLAIGGGSVIDSCKAIAMGVPYHGDVWDFYLEHNGTPLAVPASSTPIGVILTIAASGSEASNSSVITNGDLKRFCDNDVNRPRFAIENPELSYSLPAYQTACGLVDVMSHSMERYFTRGAEGNQMTDALCEGVFKTCLECGRILMAKPDDYEARASVMLASTLSHNGLTGIGRAGDWSSHFIEHELSGEFDVTHGAGLAVILPAWMRYVWRDSPDIFAKFAVRVMGVDMDWEHPELVIEAGIRRLEDYFRFLGLATRLCDLPGVGALDESVMWKMAKRIRVVNADGTVGALKRLHAEDVVRILELANR